MNKEKTLHWDNKPKNRGIWCWDCDDVWIDRTENNYKFDEDGNILCLECFDEWIEEKFAEGTKDNPNTHCGECCPENSPKHDLDMIINPKFLLELAEEVIELPKNVRSIKIGDPKEMKDQQIIFLSKDYEN